MKFMKHLKYHSRSFSYKRLCSVILAALGSPLSLFAADVTLAWDPSPDTGVGSYRLHYGTNSGNYTSATNAGLNTILTVNGLQEGITYFFAATAVGTNQLESDFSNEISYTVPVPSNQPPAITLISDQSIDEDATAGPVGFSISDPETAADSLALTGSSSNPSLVPDANIVFGGSGTNRTVTVTPLADAWGAAQISVVVSDGELSVTNQFIVTVNSVNDVPTITGISDLTIDEDTATGPINFSVGDTESPADSLTLSGSSSNPTLVPDANIVFSGSGASRSVVVTPAPNQFGTTQISIAVSDGELTAAQTFTLTVNSVEDPPAPPGNLRLAQAAP